MIGLSILITYFTSLYFISVWLADHFTTTERWTVAIVAFAVILILQANKKKE